MDDKMVLCALIGLAGAVANNGTAESTDSVVIDALIQGDVPGMVDAVHRAKFEVSPGCATCATPCGNTSDYDISKFDNADADVLTAKSEVYVMLKDFASLLKSQWVFTLPDVVYKAISYLGYDLPADRYYELMEEINNVKASYKD